MLYLYSFIITAFFPEGINKAFVNRALPFFPASLGITFAAYFLTVLTQENKPIHYLIKNNSSFTINHLELLSIRDLTLIIFPMTPIVQYIIANHSMLSNGDIFKIMLFTISIVFFCSYLVPSILSIFASRKFLTLVSLSFVFITFNMPSLASSQGWHNEGSFIFQLTIFFIVLLILSFLYFYSFKMLSVLILIFFGMNSTSNLLNVSDSITHKSSINKSQFGANSDLPIDSIVKGSINSNNNIFFLVYESYANYETLLHYGFDNKDQIRFLKENGFHIYYSTYSLGTPSFPSLSRVLNIHTHTPSKRSIAGDEAVFRILKEQGYTTYGIFQNDVHFRGLSLEDIHYDSYFPPAHDSSNLLIHAILGGEFSDEVSLQGVGFEAYFEKKHSILSLPQNTPKFVYAHSPLPGHRLLSAQDPMSVKKHTDFYLRRLKYANREMRQDIVAAIENNPDAILIISGDHGPFLTKSGFGLHQNPKSDSKVNIDRYDLQDRYGAFLAIRWPNKDYAQEHDIVILQDIFPAVFAYLFDDHTLFEKTRIKPRKTISPQDICGVYIENGTVVGGIDNGKPLFQDSQ